MTATLYTTFFTAFFLLLFAALVFYVVSAVSSLFEDKDELSTGQLFLAFIFISFLTLVGWMLWEGYRYVISMGPL